MVAKKSPKDKTPKAKAKITLELAESAKAKRKQSEEDRKQIRKKLRSCGLVSHIADMRRED